MKKKNLIGVIILPVIITLSILVVFSSRIATKPSDAGFWMILTFGMSLGVALTRIILWYKEKTK
ncbi:MAG: hypothetical protein HXX16_03065 [Bacteroidales bacterium]|nr:hypothetical protein [Bacteroidales bacterium]